MSNVIRRGWDTVYPSGSHKLKIDALIEAGYRQKRLLVVGHLEQIETGLPAHCLSMAGHQGSLYELALRIFYLAIQSSMVQAKTVFRVQLYRLFGWCRQQGKSIYRFFS